MPVPLFAPPDRRYSDRQARMPVSRSHRTYPKAPSPVAALPLPAHSKDRSRRSNTLECGGRVQRRHRFRSTGRGSSLSKSHPTSPLRLSNLKRGAPRPKFPPHPQSAVAGHCVPSAGALQSSIPPRQHFGVRWQSATATPLSKHLPRLITLKVPPDLPPPTFQPQTRRSPPHVPASPPKAPSPVAALPLPAHSKDPSERRALHPLQFSIPKFQLLRCSAISLALLPARGLIGSALTTFHAASRPVPSQIIPE